MDPLRRRAILQALSAVGVEYGTYALVTRPGSLPLGAFMSWLVEWIWAAGLGLILVFLPLLFPNGRPPSRRWWPVAWLGGLSIGLISGSVSLLVWLLEGRGTADDPPGWLLALLQAGFPLMLLAGLLAVIALYLRFLRRAAADQVVRLRLRPDVHLDTSFRAATRPPGRGVRSDRRRLEPRRRSLDPGRHGHRHPPLPALR